MSEKSFGRVLFLVMGLSLITFSEAHAIGLSFLGGASMTNSTSVNVASTDPIYRGTFGVDFDLGIAPLFALETGLYYQVRGFSKAQAQLNAGGLRSSYESADYLTVPVLVRLSVIPGFLKVGVGPYFSYAMGDYFNSTTTTAGVQSNTFQSFSLANRNKFDFGGVASVRGFFPVAPLVDLLGDVRFQYSFLNLNTNPNLVQKYYDLMVMVGVRIGL